MYIGTIENKAILTGFYIVPILRGLKFAEKLLNKTYEYARAKGCSKINIECASYSMRAVGFYNKHFKLHNTVYENTLKEL